MAHSLEGRPAIVGFAAAGALAAAAAAMYVWWPAAPGVSVDSPAGDGEGAADDDADAASGSAPGGAAGGAEEDGPAPAVDAGDPAGQGGDDGAVGSDDDFVMVAADADSPAPPGAGAGGATPIDTGSGSVSAGASEAAATPAATVAGAGRAAVDGDDEGGPASSDAKAGEAGAQAALFQRIDDLHMSSDVDGVEVLLAPLRDAVGRGGDAADDAQVLWRCARNAKCMADHAAADAAKARRYGKPKQLYGRAVEFAQRAVEANEGDAGAHKWASIAYAKVGDSTKEKIANAYKIRDHATRSIELDPADPAVHHVLGQFCAGVAKLSWLERKAAAALFGEPPSSTYAEALAHLERAEDLKPGFYVGNRVALAQTCQAMGDKAAARAWLRRALAMPRLAEEAEEWEALEGLRKQLGA